MELRVRILDLRERVLELKIGVFDRNCHFSSLPPHLLLQFIPHGHGDVGCPVKLSGAHEPFAAVNRDAVAGDVS